MAKPSEHKTVQSSILPCAETIAWASVSREETEQQRGMAEEGLCAIVYRFCDIERSEYDKNGN